MAKYIVTVEFEVISSDLRHAENKVECTLADNDDTLDVISWEITDVKHRK